MTEVVVLALFVVVVGLVLVSFSSAMTALLRMSRARAAALADPDVDGDDDESIRHAAQANALRGLLEHRARTLTPMWLVLIAGVVVLATVIAIFANNRWGTSGVFVAVALEVVALFTAIGTAQVRTLANLDSVALSVATRLGSFMQHGIWSWTNVLVGRGSADTEEEPDATTVVLESEIRHLAELAAEGQSIDVEDQELIESSLLFGDTIVREVMVPRPDMITVPATRSIHDVLEMAIVQGFSRLPVTGEGIDDIVGVVHARNLMAALLDEVDNGAQDQKLQDVWNSARFVPETKNISKLLREMQEEKFHLAIVIDEYGGTAGLVTLEDLIEEIVGEIVDEFDIEEPMIEPLEDGSTRVNGKAEVWMLDDALGTQLPAGDWSTVGGLIFNTLGHVPAEGESLELDGYRLEVEDVKGSRIARVRISSTASRTPTSDETDDE